MNYRLLDNRLLCLPFSRRHFTGSMPSKEYNLRDTLHVYLGSNLKLTTSCSIKLSSSHMFIFPFSAVFQNLNLLASSGLWIDRGHGLKMSFRLLMNGLCFHDIERAPLLECLGAVLCNAEVVFRSESHGSETDEGILRSGHS